MRKKYIIDPELQKKKEEKMRPSKVLGYDHDRLGIHFLNIKAYELAESEFQRAVYLNPYEVNFKIHLSLCCIKLNQMQEAENIAKEVMENEPDNAKALELLEYIKNYIK